MKPNDLRALTKDELNLKISSFKEELSGLRFQQKTGTIEKSARISLIRKDIARIQTILKENSYAK
ncbi:MAG: 50S ribosomal protein L29 [Candidatus Omnitrophota bacterium]|jgi:large subunit ribosomal protein L29